jgi:hypothetical protein
MLWFLSEFLIDLHMPKADFQFILMGSSSIAAKASHNAISSRAKCIAKRMHQPKATQCHHDEVG